MAQTPSSPSFDLHTIVVNAVIGFAGVHGPFPHPLADLGYTNWRLGPVIPADGELARPDVGILAETRNRSLLCEAKGQMSDDKQRFARQLRRYARIRPEDVLQWAGFAVSAPPAPDTHISHEFIACPETCAGEIADWLSRIEVECPVLALSLGAEDARVLEGVYLQSGRFSDHDLNSTFADRLPEPQHIPMYQFPFGPNSGVEHIVHAVVPEMIARFQTSAEGDSFTPEDICGRIFPSWKRIDPDMQSEILGKAQPLLWKAVKSKFSDFLALRADCIRVKTAPPDHTGTEQSLERRFQEFLQDLGVPSQVPSTFQPELPLEGN